MYVPVVFFAAKGIPGEVDERLDTKEGLVSAAARHLSRGRDVTVKMIPKAGLGF
jgi:hypothetical protein